MSKYVFVAFGDSIEIEADGFDIIAERNEALGKANEWLGKLEGFATSEPGGWYEMAEPFGFKWVTGIIWD